MTTIEVLSRTQRIIVDSTKTVSVVRGGPIGPGGPRGLQGIRGIQGEQGDKGDTGADSTVTGPKGDKGDTGDTGAKGDKGDTGDTGADSTVPGPKGDKGDTGGTGPGVAAGGTTGQVLKKNSNADYDTGWTTLGTAAASAATDFATPASLTSAVATEASDRATADALLIPLSQKNAANGVAPLDSSSLVPDANIPSVIARDSEVTAAVAAEATARNSAIATAIANLVNGAPTLVDTLGEIATLMAADEATATALATTVSGKQASHANLTALSGLLGAADKLAYFTGSGAMNLTDFSAYGRNLIACANAAAGRTALGLGTAALAAATDFASAAQGTDTRTPTAGSVVTASFAAANNDGTAGVPSARTLGTGAQQACAGNDSRLSDTRTPTAGSVVTASFAAANNDGAAGVPSARTLGTGAQQACAGNDSRLSDTRTPTDGSVVTASFAAANKDGTAGTASARTLGTGAQQACAGNDARLSDTRTPSDGTVSVAKFTDAAIDALLPWQHYIDVILPATGHTTWNSVSVSTLLVNNAWLLSGGAQNALVYWEIVLAKGTWQLEWYYEKANNMGIFTPSIGPAGGASQVDKATVDAYASVSAHNLLASIDLGAVASTGKYRIQFKMATRNASNTTGYYGAIMAMQLRRTA